jgi:hypothetical protein
MVSISLEFSVSKSFLSKIIIENVELISYLEEKFKEL